MYRSSWLAVGLALTCLAPFALAAEGDGDAAKGKELFETKCSICHNVDNKEKKIGPGLQGIKDGKLPSGKDATYANILENLDKGGGGMPAFDKLLTSEEKDHIVAYVLTL
jgi:mono/diheme cytochrome c family protein